VRVVVDIIIALFVVGTLVGAYLAGLAVGLRRNYDARLRDMGLHRQSARLYTRAVRILNRLLQVSDLDGVLAGDTLSPETRELVVDWLTEHKRELSKV
jgi:uncharacterized membrane protein